MAFNDLTIIDQLRQTIHYDPKSGALTWKTRTPDMFADTLVKGKFLRTAASTCTAWNTKYAGKPALNVPCSGGDRLHGHILGTRLSAHRAAWMIFYGEMPAGQIDHINGDGRDNRIKNLRDVGRVENARNIKISVRNSTGFLGVRQDPRDGRWSAQIGDSSQKWGRFHLGTFGSKAEAIAARRAAEIVLGYHPNHGRR